MYIYLSIIKLGADAVGVFDGMSTLFSMRLGKGVGIYGPCSSMAHVSQDIGLHHSLQLMLHQDSRRAVYTCIRYYLMVPYIRMVYLNIHIFSLGFTNLGVGYAHLLCL